MRVRWLPLTLTLALAATPALITAPTAVLSARHAANLLGWLGAGLLATSLLLAIREPRFSAWFGGIDRMYRWHHSLSTLGYVAILAHPIVLACSALPTDPLQAWRTISPLGQTWGVSLGWIALVGMTAGLTSTFAVRISYGLWRQLHAALGLAALMGIAHVLAVAPTSQGGWFVMAPVLATIVWRLLRADRGRRARPYEVREVRAIEHGGVSTAQVQLRPLASPLQLRPGQFVMAAFFEGPHFRGCGEYHPYTASRVSTNGELTLDIKALGDCTRHLQALEAGVAVRLDGPYGTFMLDRPAAPELWIAGGIGITPFLAVLRSGPVTQPTDFVYVVHDLKLDPYMNELQNYAGGGPGLQFEALAMGTDPAPLLAKLAALRDLTAREVYLCGPVPLMDVVIKWLRQQGVAQARIHLENFDFR